MKTLGQFLKEYKHLYEENFKDKHGTKGTGWGQTTVTYKHDKSDDHEHIGTQKEHHKFIVSVHNEKGESLASRAIHAQDDHQARKMFLNNSSQRHHADDNRNSTIKVFKV